MNNLLFFFSALGVFNGILMSMYLLIFNKKKSLSKYLLGALILVLSIRIGKSVILYFDRDVHKAVLQIGLSACLFIGPFLYMYLSAAINKKTVMPRIWKWLLVGLAVAILVVGMIRPYHLDPLFWNEYVVNGIYTVWFISMIPSSILMYKHFASSFEARGGISAFEKWLLVIYIANVIIATAFFIALFGGAWAYYMTGPLVFSFFLYVGAYGYFNSQWFDWESKTTIEKYSNKKIDANHAKKTLDDLNVLMQDKKLYKNSTLKLGDLATALNIPSHQLSQILNDNLGKSFRTYLNELRIDAACDILSTDHQLSVEGVGYEVGFKSKSNFFTTFKKLKQVTPSKYQAQVGSRASSV